MREIQFAKNLSNITIDLAGNRNGRDIFIGDLHGHLDLLNKGLSKLNFNPSCDRLVAVGDLIDRGPSSFECLRLLNNDWFFSALGNHEYIFYKRFIEKNRKSNISTRWQCDLSESDFEECIYLIQQMPLAITVGMKSMKIGVVHAGVPFNFSWTKFINALNDHDEKVTKFAIYDRNIVHQTQVIDGIDYVCVGHQGLDKVEYFGNQICIDTAAFLKPWPGEAYGLSFCWFEGGKPKFLTVPQI